MIHKYVHNTGDKLCSVPHFQGKQLLDKTHHKTDPERGLKLFPLHAATDIYFWHALPPPHRRIDYPMTCSNLQPWDIFCEQLSTRPKPTNSGTWTFSKLVASPPSCTCILHRFKGFYEPAGKYINILQNGSQTWLCNTFGAAKRITLDAASHCNLHNANQVGN